MRSIRRNHTGHRMGEQHHRARLSDAQVVEIRAAHRPGEHGLGYGALASRYGVGESTIRDIITYRTRPI